MTHEKFIELETARLAKQAGFDWKVKTFYNSLGRACVGFPCNWNDETEAYQDTSRPTQAVLQRWLREVKRVDIIVEFAIIDDIDVPYSYDLWIADKEYASKNSWRTYEAALEACLQKCLSLLIEKQ